MTNEEILENLDFDISTDSIIEYTEKDILLAMDLARDDERDKFKHMEKQVIDLLNRTGKTNLIDVLKEINRLYLYEHNL